MDARCSFSMDQSSASPNEEPRTQLQTVAEGIVMALAAYGAAGIVFAVPFLWRGARAVDPAARGATLGFRVLVLPGVVALWPLLLLKWRRARAGYLPGDGA